MFPFKKKIKTFSASDARKASENAQAAFVADTKMIYLDKVIEEIENRAKYHPNIPQLMTCLTGATSAQVKVIADELINRGFDVSEFLFYDHAHSGPGYQLTISW